MGGFTFCAGRKLGCWKKVRATLSDMHARLCIKVGRGQGDGDIGTRVWGLGPWGRETRDLGTSSVGRGDAGTSKTRMQGTRDVNENPGC